MARVAGLVGDALSFDHLVSHKHCCSDCCLSTSLQGREDAWFRSLGKSGTSHHKATFWAVISCSAAARAAPPGQTSRALRQIPKLWLFPAAKSLCQTVNAGNWDWLQTTYSLFIHSVNIYWAPIAYWAVKWTQYLALRTWRWETRSRNSEPRRGEKSQQ